MDFRHLRQFVVLAETLNFRRAAEKLHMSQPPLSVSIRKLETELGVALFHRGKDGVRLTKSGEAALQDARRALFHAGEFVNSAKATAKGERGLLRIGFVGSATRAVLPAIVPVFRHRYPAHSRTLPRPAEHAVAADRTPAAGRTARPPPGRRCHSADGRSG